LANIFKTKSLTETPIAATDRAKAMRYL